MQLNFRDNRIEFIKKKRKVEDILKKKDPMEKVRVEKVLMGCFKKGQRLRSTDLWQMTGGRDMFQVFKPTCFCLFLQH